MNGVIVTFLQASHTPDGDPESHVPGVGDNSRPNPDAESWQVGRFVSRGNEIVERNTELHDLLIYLSL